MSCHICDRLFNIGHTNNNKVLTLFCFNYDLICKLTIIDQLGTVGVGYVWSICDGSQGANPCRWLCWGKVNYRWWSEVINSRSSSADLVNWIGAMSICYHVLFYIHFILLKEVIFSRQSLTTNLGVANNYNSSLYLFTRCEFW